jgi:hypothetical protein
MRACTPVVAPFLIGVVTLASCSETTIVAKPPLIELAETRYDAGRVRQGERVEHTFVFRNAGQRDLRISHVRPSCDCTATGAESVVPPGQTGEIVASFDTAGLAGEVTRTTAVFSNDPSAPVVHLKLIASIDFDVAANPPSFYVGSVQPGEEVRVQGRLAVAAGNEIARIESPGSVVEARLVEPAAAGAPAAERRFRVRIRDQAPAGAFTENVIVHTSSPRTPTLPIAVVGVVEENT